MSDKRMESTRIATGLRVAAFVAALIAIQGLATVQSVRYLEDFITYPQSPAVMYATALVVGGLIGWVTTNPRGVFLLPLLVVFGAALVFFLVAYSPVWAGNSRHSIAVINELLRQSTLIVVLTLVPIYVGVFAGFIARQTRE